MITDIEFSWQGRLEDTTGEAHFKILSKGKEFTVPLSQFKEAINLHNLLENVYMAGQEAEAKRLKAAVIAAVSN